jgi:DNA-binding GntR family transcriptional regulator
VTAARKANDGPALAEAGPAAAERQGAGRAEVPEPSRHYFETGTAPAGAARPTRSQAGAESAGPIRSSARVLADRLAAALVHHEPGWRMPRHSALARRYNVSAAEIDAAIGELAARRLVRRLPDGQVYRASPAEYLIPLAGAPGLASHIDPMGGQIACQSRQVSWRRVPEDIGWALGIPPGDQARVVRLLWTSDGEPAALATTYLARHLTGQPAGQASGEPCSVPQAVLATLPLFGVTGRGEPGPDDAGTGADAGADSAAACLPRALFVELQPPPAAVARSLRLSAGQPAAMVTVRFDDPAKGRPAALTVAVLRPDMFRIVVESPASLLPDGTAGSFSGAWTYALQDWEP